MKLKEIRVGEKGPGKEEPGWGAAKRKTEVRELQGERKDRQERWGKGEGQRAEDGGWERVKQSRRPGPPFNAFHTVLAGGQAKPKSRGKPGVAHRYGLWRLSRLPCRTLCTHVCSMLYNMLKMHV